MRKYHSLTRTIWYQSLNIYNEFSRRGEKLSRIKLANILDVNEQLAREILFALNNKEIIKLNNTTTPIYYNKALIFGDTHFTFQNNNNLEIILEKAEQEQVSCIILNGDILDFYKLSKYTIDPNKKDANEEIIAVEKFLSNIRLRFPKIHIIYKEGNHEQRLQKTILQKVPELYNILGELLYQKLNLEKYNIEYIIEPFQIGKLWVLHGHEKPFGSYNPEHICNVMWGYIHDHFITNHFHRTQDKIFKRINGDYFWTGAIGYHSHPMEYSILNKWSESFAIIKFENTGKFRAEIYKIHNGEII